MPYQPYIMMQAHELELERTYLRRDVGRGPNDVPRRRVGLRARAEFAVAVARVLSGRPEIGDFGDRPAVELGRLEADEQNVLALDVCRGSNTAQQWVGLEFFLGGGASAGSERAGGVISYRGG